MRSRPGVARVARRFVLVAAVGLGMPLVAVQAQDAFNPLPEGLRFAAQVGLAWSTLTGVDATTEQEFSKHRSIPFSLRLTHNVVGPLVGFVEGGSAERGAQVRTPGEPDAELRTRWWELAGGLSVVGKCISFACPALDAGIGVSRNRQSVLYSSDTNRPVGTIPIARYETSAIVGVRVAIPQLRGLAVVVRHQEGFTNLPTDDTRARSRSQQVMLSLPLVR